MKSSLIASANFFIISARMSCSENTAEKRSFGLSCASAGERAAAASSRRAEQASRGESMVKFMVFLPLADGVRSSSGRPALLSTCGRE